MRANGYKSGQVAAGLWMCIVSKKGHEAPRALLDGKEVKVGNTPLSCMVLLTIAFNKSK